MTNRSKIPEGQFYLDRSQDSLLALLRSIVGNPRLQADEHLAALKLMGDFHHEVANFIWKKICEGESKGYTQASNHNAAVQQSARLEPQPNAQDVENPA